MSDKKQNKQNQFTTKPDETGRAIDGKMGYKRQDDLKDIVCAIIINDGITAGPDLIIGTAERFLAAIEDRCSDKRNQ